MDIIPQAPPQKQCSKCEQTFPLTSEFYQLDNRRNSFSSQCKACREIYRKQYYEKNKAKISERGKQHYASHKQEIREHQIVYEEENKAKILARREQYKVTRKEYELERGRKRRQEESYKTQQKQYREAHKEELLEYGQKYREENKDRLNEQKKEYYRTEKGQMVARAHTQNRLAQKKSAPGTLTTKQIEDKLKKQKFRCYYAACGYAKLEKKKGKYLFHLDHTIPLSRTEHNPRHDINYVVLCCPHCNLVKSAKLPHEWEGSGRLF